MASHVFMVLCLCVLLVAAITCGTDAARMPSVAAAAVVTPPSLDGAPVSAPTKKLRVPTFFGLQRRYKPPRLLRINTPSVILWQAVEELCKWLIDIPGLVIPDFAMAKRMAEGMLHPYLDLWKGGGNGTDGLVENRSLLKRMVATIFSTAQTCGTRPTAPYGAPPAPSRAHHDRRRRCSGSCLRQHASVEVHRGQRARRVAQRLLYGTRCAPRAPAARSSAAPPRQSGLWQVRRAVPAGTRCLCRQAHTHPSTWNLGRGFLRTAHPRCVDRSDGRLARGG